jgi:hypothetical protein
VFVALRTEMTIAKEARRRVLGRLGTPVDLSLIKSQRGHETVAIPTSALYPHPICPHTDQTNAAGFLPPRPRLNSAAK